MKFQMRPYVAVQTETLTDAVKFYSNVLGFRNRPTDPALGDHDTNPLKLYGIEDNEIQGLVMELLVDDLEQGRDELIAQDCKVIRWHGKDQDCYIKDPFGLIFNLWEKQGI
jgi:hypothetical protein